jgi:hypothetical protein
MYDGPAKVSQLQLPVSAEKNPEDGRVKHQAKVASPNVHVRVVANSALSLRQPLESTPTCGDSALKRWFGSRNDHFNPRK